MAPASCAELAPGRSQLLSSPLLLVADERVQDVELVCRPRQAPLLELAGHGEQTLRRGGEILPCDRAAPGVGARATVGEHPPGQDETLLIHFMFVLRRELRETGQLVVVPEPLGRVELRLDEGLLRSRADEPRVALGAEEEPERLRENRFSRAGLARDRAQPRGRHELGLADQDEVLDAEATKQRSCCSG